MKQITVRIDDEKLQRELTRLAREKRLSLNKAALELLRRGAGLDETPRERDTIGHSLDAFFGIWTEEAAREFEEAVAPLEEIDEELWR